MSILSQACNLQHRILLIQNPLELQNIIFVEIEIFENSHFTACAKISVLKITGFMIKLVRLQIAYKMVMVGWHLNAKCQQSSKFFVHY